MPPLTSHSLSDKGLCRDNNEDCFLSEPAHGLWAVADGMGGHEAGEVASAIVRDTLAQHPTQNRNLEDVIADSHKAVLTAADTGIGAKGMGSTVVALNSQGHDYQVSWVGDSRAYLWSIDGDGGRLEQLTTDHSYVQMLLTSGAIGPDEVDNHPDKNIITQCIGSQDIAEVRVDSVHGEWQKQQWVLLCSDGLSDEVDNPKIAQLLCRARNTKEAAQYLMTAALESGGHDNITIQVIASPLNSRHPLAYLEQWLPNLSGRRWLDACLVTAALTSLALIYYWNTLA